MEILLEFSLFSLLFWTSFLLSLSQLLTLFFNALAGPFLRRRSDDSIETFPSVSVLIPARNEEHNIGNCLASLLQQDVPIHEIIVFDDRSEDGTAEIVKNFALAHSVIRLAQGDEPPAGWTGKNNACHRLSRLAEGELLLFTDADNTYSPMALRSSIATMQRYKADIVSAFPQQLLSSTAETMAVPLVDIILYGSLPLQAALRLPFSSMTAANGQWILLSREAYDSIGGHEAVRSAIVEDVEMSRLAKRKGLRVCTAAGTGAVFGRMYSCHREVWEGFGKNLYGIAGNNSFVLFFLLFFLLATGFLPFVLPLFAPFSPFLLLLPAIPLLTRIVAALAFSHPWSSIWLQIPATFYVFAIGIRSFIGNKSGNLTWKGRVLPS